MENNSNIQKPGTGKIWSAIVLFWIPLLSWILYYLDAKAVVKYCKEAKGETESEFFLSVLWFFIFPAYIWKRNKLTGSSQTTFYVSLALLLLGIVASIASAVAGA